MVRTFRRILLIASLAALSCAFLIAWSPAGVRDAWAQVPPPPSKTPIEPTLTPLTPPVTTPPATDTAAPPTDTPVPPTNTPVPPVATGSPEPPSTPRPDPNCQSVVEGNVLDAAGKRVRGATVTIEGAGWSHAMLTDDDGHYGFGGLCPGTATLRAALPGGRVSPTTMVDLDGKKHLYLDLSLQPAQASATATRSTVQPTATGEPDMPATGYSGWLPVGAGVLGALLLLTAGARRLLGGRERPGGRP